MSAFQSLDTLDNGKPFKDAFGDIGVAVDVVRYFAGLADKVVGQTIPAGSLFQCSSISVPFLCSVLCVTASVCMCINGGGIGKSHALQTGVFRLLTGGCTVL